MAGNIATKLVAEAVVTLTDGDLSCHPEGAVAGRCPYLESLVRPRKVPDWQVARSSHSEELAVVGKPAKVASLGRMVSALIGPIRGSCAGADNRGSR
jgi:hypothetical protein